MTEASIHKERLLQALDIAIDDLSEGVLLEVLIAAYEQKKAECAKLQGENAQERENLHLAEGRLLEEQHRLRNDPLYGAAGEYYFDINGRRFGVVVQGSRMDMFERKGNIDYAARQMPPAEWNAQ